MAPDTVDARLMRRQLMAEMFDREVEAPRFGRFEVRERIGHGGMGVVYRAWDPQLERAVAIKVIDTSGVGEPLRERALVEARSLAKLTHPNVVTVFESGLAEHRVWIAMELVEGATLEQWLAGSPRPDDATILAHWIAVGRGLLAAHRIGLVHRDVKPSNVLVGDDGRPRLIDFGLVHGRADAAPTGGFVGTYRYAAPEQRRGDAVDAAADQYALCASIWESLCGQPAPALPEGARMSKALRAVLLRGLAERPADRFASVAELLTAIEVCIAPRRFGARAWAVTGLVALAGIIVLTRVLATSDTPVDPCPIEIGALAGTWDESRRTSLRERFAGARSGYAATTAATVERGIDDWAARWRDARQSACRAARVQGSETEPMLATRHACLEQQRRSLQVTLETWLDASEDLDLLAHAPALLERLPELTACADASRLADVEPMPEPGPAREAVLAAYDELSEARVLADAGAPDRAAAMIAAIETSAPATLAYAPLRLELHALPAQLDVARGRIFAAVPKLVELSREAEARHLDLLAAQLRVEAAVAAAGRWSGPQQERFLVDEAETALRRLARPREPLSASLLHARGALSLQAGELDDALTSFRDARAQAIELGQEALAEREHWYIAATLGQLGRYPEAQTLLDEGRAEAIERWGTDAPLVGAFEFDLAVLSLETGRTGEVDAHLDRAEAIFGAAFGLDSFMVARVRYARAKARMAEGELAAAFDLVESAFAAYLRELGSDHLVLAELHEARGVLRFFRGDLGGSIEAYEAALAITRAVLPPDHASLARLHSNLGESQAALGRLRLARESFERALEIYGRTLPPDHPELALPLKGRGQVALASGDAAQAVDDLERALALQLGNDAEPLELADVRFSLARALASNDGMRSARARELARLARDDFARLQLPDRVDAVEAWLR